MSAPHDAAGVHPTRAKIEIAAAVALTVPGFVVRFTDPHLHFGISRPTTPRRRS